MDSEISYISPRLIISDFSYLTILYVLADPAVFYLLDLALISLVLQP